MKNDKENKITVNTPADDAKSVEVEPVEMRPAVDILEGPEGVSLFFEVPGANAKSVEVEVDDGVLYINAKSSLRRNGRPVVYKRAFQISDAVDVENISAKTADGVLTLLLPKSEKAKVHKIKVSC